MDFNQIKPLNDVDEVEIDDAQKCCYIFIRDNVGASTVVLLKVSDDGDIKAVNSSCLPVRRWEPIAKCYARALQYEKMVRFLK
jgi:hypothetical protein